MDHSESPEQTKQSPQFRQVVSQARTVALYRARWEEPTLALHDIVGELLSQRYPGVVLTYGEVLEMLRTGTLDPLESLPDPSTADHWLQKGRVLQGEGLWCGGAACFSKALELDPDRADAWVAKSNVLLRFADALLGSSSSSKGRGLIPSRLGLRSAESVLNSASACCHRALALEPQKADGALIREACAGAFPWATISLDLPISAAVRARSWAPAAFLASLRSQRENARLSLHPSEEYESTYKDCPEQLALARRRQPPGRDDSMLQEMLNDLLEGMPLATRFLVTEQVAVGEFLTKDANAVLAKACPPHEGYALYVTRGWRTLLHSIGKALLLAAETTPGTFINSAPFTANGTDEEAQMHVNHLLAQLRRGQLPHVAPKELVLPDNKARFLALLNVYAVVFTLGHELGHLLLGHMESPMSQSHEFEADQAGFAMLLNWLYKRLPSGEMQDRHVEAAIAGAELVFAGMSLLEASGQLKSGTHPPMPDRFNSLRDAFTLSDAVYQLPNMMMRRTLELRNRALRENTNGRTTRG